MGATHGPDVSVHNTISMEMSYSRCHLGHLKTVWCERLDTIALGEETYPDDPKRKGMLACEADDIPVLEPQNPVYAKGRKGSDMLMAKCRRMSCLVA